MSEMLKVTGLEVAYGGIRAVKGIDLAVGERELVTLIGANGAGKTTALKALAGLINPARGRVQYNGRETAGMPAHELVGLGLALVPEGRGVFARLTVEENLAMGAYIRRDRHVAADFERAYALFPRLAERRRQLAGTLSGGEQQMLAIARALMSRPKLLLLDEPSMGLAPMLIQQIFDIITEINQQGTTVLLVEQNAQQALTRAHRGYVMETGRIVKEGTGADLLNDPAVKEAYLGVA